MKKEILLIIANGYEDIETVAPIDVLNRLGAHVHIVGLEKKEVKGAYGSTLIADKTLSDLPSHRLYDAVILPGGMNNAKSLANSSVIRNIVQEHFSSGAIVAAICAAPSLVLGESARILKERQATGDSSFNDRLAACGAKVRNCAVVQDANIITASGPAAALAFGFAIAKALFGAEAVKGHAEKWGIA